MRRRRNRSDQAWCLDHTDPHALYNARVTRALLRCVRLFPSVASKSMWSDDIAKLAVPVLMQVDDKLQAALLALLDQRAKGGRRQFDAEPYTAPKTMKAAADDVGDLLWSRLPPVNRAFAAMDRVLERFLKGQRAATDGNVEMLAQLLGLNRCERAFLQLAASVAASLLDMSMFDFITSSHTLRVLETLLGASTHEVEAILRPSGALGRSGLFENIGGRDHRYALDDHLKLSTLGARLLTRPFANQAEMAQAILKPLPQGPGTAALHWPHLAAQQQMVEAALRTALAQGQPGINILLHGGPGTGKTEFARQLVASVGGSGYEIACADEDGDEAKRSDRLASLRLSQLFASRQDGAVLVLDEAEDIFQNDYQSPLSRLFGAKPEGKAWVNHLLEHNTHPVVWITNDASYLDPAYLRRFTFCLAFPQTPLSLRRRIAEQVLLPVGCGADTLDAVASDEASSPALLASAARFATLAQAGGSDPGAAALMHLNQQRLARGQTAPPLAARLTQRFDLRYLNIEGHAQPAQIIQALRQDPAAALVFGGPPGTGKTQLAAEMARQLDRRLVVKTASDINSMWHGQSEANVAQMFRSCDPSSELLFLDEAEVLLGERGSAGHRADQAVTAEFLRWLECFEGTFICATNHAATFDAALARRFAFRLEFLPLNLTQRCELFAEQALGWQPASGTTCPALAPKDLRRLQALERLTPGDFANAGRRVRRLGLGLEPWLDELEAEHAAKASAGSSRRRVGFL